MNDLFELKDLKDMSQDGIVAVINELIKERDALRVEVSALTAELIPLQVKQRFESVS